FSRHSSNAQRDCPARSGGSDSIRRLDGMSCLLGRLSHTASRLTFWGFARLRCLHRQQFASPALSCKSPARLPSHVTCCRGWPLSPLSIPVPVQSFHIAPG